MIAFVQKLQVLDKQTISISSLILFGFSRFESISNDFSILFSSNTNVAQSSKVIKGALVN
jgi:hypothetical protein